MPYKDPEKRKQYQRQYYKQYNSTPEAKKNSRIAHWKHRGIIFHDYDLLHEMYIATYYCDECECELNKCNSSRKCLDHDHSITDKDNFRNILCHLCNIKRG